MIGFKNYIIELVDSPNPNDVYFDNDAVVDGVKSRILYIKKGNKAQLKFKYIGKKLNDNSLSIKWIFAGKDNLGYWKDVGWQGKGKLIRTNLDKQEYEHFDEYEYAQSTHVTVVAYDNYVLGRFYWLEPFFEFPEFDKAKNPKGIYVVFYDNPQLISAKVIRQSGQIHSYHQKVSIELTSLRPVNEKEFYDLYAVTVYSRKLNTPVSIPLYFYPDNKTRINSFNVRRELELYIDAEWKKKANHPIDKIEEFYLKIEEIIHYNSNIVSNNDEKEKNLGEIIHDQIEGKRTKTLNTVYENQSVVISYKIDKKKLKTLQDTSYLQQYEEQMEQLASFSTSTTSTIESDSFLVKYDTFEDILEAKKITVNNQIVSIGDIEYNYKGNHPCHFSKITIREISNSEIDKRADFEIFNEDKNKKFIDLTQKQTFDIIAGDERKNISIILDDINTTACDGFFLPENDRHNSPKNIFRLETINYSLERDSKNRIIKNPHKSPVQNVANKMGLSLKRDFDYISKSELKLMLNFEYNKNYDSIAAKSLGHLIDNAYQHLNFSEEEIAWGGRYLELDDAVKQSYLVPVSTCRYVNQLIKINVFPDIEWWVNVKFNKKNPTFVKQSKNFKHQEFNTEDRKALPLYSRRTTNSNSKEYKPESNKYKIDYEIGLKVNGETPKIKLSLGRDFPLFRVINFFLKAYELIQEITFAKYTAFAEKPISANLMNTYKDKLAERNMDKRYQKRAQYGLPFKITISQPMFSFGVYAKYSQSKKLPNRVGAHYQALLSTNPLIGIEGKLDLLYFAQFIGPIGVALKGINQVVRKINFLTLGAVHVDYFMEIGIEADFNFEISALGYHSIDGFESFEKNFTVPVLVYLKSGFNLEAGLQGIGSAKIGAEVRGEASAELRLTGNGRDNKTAFIKFNGLDAKIWLKIETKSKDDAEDFDPDSEPDYIKNILPESEPWEINL